MKKMPSDRLTTQTRGRKDHRSTQRPGPAVLPAEDIPPGRRSYGRLAPTPRPPGRQSDLRLEARTCASFPTLRASAPGAFVLAPVWLPTANARTRLVSARQLVQMRQRVFPILSPCGRYLASDGVEQRDIVVDAPRGLHTGQAEPGPSLDQPTVVS
jgi:hypothetical protein